MFSLKTEAVNRFYMTVEYQFSFLTQLKAMVHLNQTTFQHGELQAPRITKDEEAVSVVQNLIDSWNNPFAGDQNVVSISTTKEAHDDVRRDLLQSIGKEEYQKFKREWCESTPPKVKFHDPLKLKKLQTFSSLSKQKKIKTTGRAAILKADRTFFTMMIIIRQSRQIDVSHIWSWSFALGSSNARRPTKEDQQEGISSTTTEERTPSAINSRECSNYNRCHGPRTEDQCCSS